MKKVVYLFFFVFSLSNTVKAQEQYASEINEFRKQDSINPPPQHAILFVGSSSFRMWDNMQEMFSGYSVINRGFGGSNLLDLEYYLDKIVFPYQPKQIVIYSGENDIASDTVSPDMVLTRFVNVFNLIRNKMPGIPIVYVSIKPSPSRAHLLHLMITSNKRIKEFLKSKSNTDFVDVYNLMIDKKRKPRSELFIADNLHMNQQGYNIWQKAISPHLIK